jgi:hypothetical protein
MNEYSPVEISQDRTHVYVRHRFLSHVQQVTMDIARDPQVLDFNSFICRSTDWTFQFLKNTAVLQEPNLVAEESIIQICSDGGVRGNNAAYGMVLSINNTIISSTTIRLQQEYDKHTSYRCEAFGLLSALKI